MIPVILDISGTIDEFSLSKEESRSLSRYIISSVSKEYMKQWEGLVNDELNRTKIQYLQGMSVEYPDDYSAVFVLDGKGDSRVALMLEQGASPFDQKEGFSKSNKKKLKKGGGWFLTIPFKLGTAQVIADSNVFAGKMPEPIQNIAKGQDKGIKKTQIPQEFQFKGVRKEIKADGKTFPEYKHKSLKYEGVIHNKAKGHGGYMKFRRVSDESAESNPNSWIHPGFRPYNLMEKALDKTRIDFIQSKAIDEFLNKVL